MAKQIKNPCVSLCQLKDGICVGCGRTTDEIRRWKSMKRPERMRTTQQVEQRLKKLNRK